MNLSKVIFFIVISVYMISLSNGQYGQYNAIIEKAVQEELRHELEEELEEQYRNETTTPQPTTKSQMTEQQRLLFKIFQLLESRGCSGSVRRSCNGLIRRCSPSILTRRRRSLFQQRRSAPRNYAQYSVRSGNGQRKVRVVVNCKVCRRWCWG